MSTPLRRRVLASLLWPLAVVALVVPAALAAEGEQAPAGHPLLDEARRNVADITSQLDGARGDRDDAAAALREVDDRLVAVEQSVNDAAAAVERQRLEVAAAQDRLAELRVVVDRFERQLEQRSVRMYMHGSPDGLTSLLAAGDVRDVADRSSYIDLVTAADEVSLETAASARRSLQGAAARFDDESDRLERMEREQRALLAEVEQLRTARSGTLAAAESEVDDLEALQDDVSDDYDRIAALIEQGTATAVAAAPPTSDGYGWPMCTRLNSRFGYRWGRLHKGIDLDGNVGDPIAAAKAGTVISAGYQGGYGNLVLIDHGDGIVTAYAHQSRMAVASGQRVERGELIGLVGNTGASTGPHLHFETRVNGTAVDPLQHLPGGC